MATKTYNITFILILILIIILLWVFMIPIQPSYYNLSNKTLLEGAANISSEIKPELLKDTISLEKHWGISFTVQLNNIPKDGRWHQIIGITPSENADDKRFFAVWHWPNSNMLHIRTATINNDNDEIIGRGAPIDVGKLYRFDVTATLTDAGDKQNIIVYMTNLSGNGQRSQIANVMLSAPRYISGSASQLGLRNGQIDTPQVYMFGNYNNWPRFDGILKEVVSAKGTNDPILLSNLDNERQKIVSQTKPPRQGFNTMTDAYREGLTNIGGLGNNGNIPGITPPTNSVNPSPAVNYTPFTIRNTNQLLCEKSIVQPTDPSFNWISQYGYNYPIEFGSNGSVTKSVPICSPDDLYSIQNEILKQLNDFNEYYANFMIYKYNNYHSARGDTTKPLDYEGIDADTATGRYAGKTQVTDLQQYIDLSGNLQKYNDLLKANKAYYPNPENPSDPETDLSRIDPTVLAEKHRNILDKRNKLDTKLFELNNVQNSAAGESKMNMDSSIYVTLLWTTLATSIIYFMFV